MNPRKMSIDLHNFPQVHISLDFGHCKIKPAIHIKTNKTLKNEAFICPNKHINKVLLCYFTY